MGSITSIRQSQGICSIICNHWQRNRTLTLTYSMLHRTYSLLCKRTAQNPSQNIFAICWIEGGISLPSRMLHRHSLCHSSSNTGSSSSSQQVEFLQSHNLQHRFDFTKSLFTSCQCLCASPDATIASHRPKREGELLKYSNLLRSPKQRFVLTRGLAKTIREVLWPGDSLKDESATIITANEGPGFISRELLDHGASKVLALCRQDQFGPALEEIRLGCDPESFQWQHADIYQMQYIGDREVQRPVARVEDVFQDIDPVAWEEDIGVKVIGALPQDGERKHAYVLASLILERLSMFSYGRVQLNLFMTENCYSTLIHPPGHMKNYRALSALYQVSCDLKLLHTEPIESFKLPRKKKKVKESDEAEKEQEYLHLVQITPKQDLFTRHQLEQWEAFIFVFFIRQALARRREKLHKVIDVWAPGSRDVISEFGYNSKTAMGDVSGDDLLAIFCRICKQENFNGAWMGEEVMGWASGRPQELNTLELSQALGSINPK